MTAQRDSLIKKIKALLGKTTENGCTEQEALTAAAHAATLMEQYDLTFKDIEKEIREQKFDTNRRPFGHHGPSGRRHYPAARDCVRGVANFFDCEYWFHGIDLVFFGTADDTNLAHSMVTMLQGAIQHEADAYLMRTVSNEHRKSLRASFEHGMTERIQARLLALKRARTEADKKAHEALATQDTSTFHPPVVVAKQLAVRENFEALGIRLRMTARSWTTGSHEGYRAGQVAGERVNLGARRGLLKS
jgi:hypothetical protein